ncbi:MAG: hypothetical protein ACLP8A_14200 [Methylovirgula sp.]
MSRIIAAAPIALIVFIAILAFTAAAVRLSLVPDDAVMLWAGAIVAGNGKMSIDRIVAAYPTIPFLVTALVAAIAPFAAPAPALVAAGVAAGLAGHWFRAFCAAGLPLLIAAPAVLCLVFHPIMLHAAIVDPAEMFLALFLYLFGTALYDLRARSGVPEVMKTGLALLGLAFSHPMGAAIAFAAPPFLIYAVQPVLVARSALNVVLALVFPAAFAVAAFIYVSWVFPGSGWSFFSAPAESLSAWLAGMASVGVKGMPALVGAGAVAMALLLGAPIVPVAISWIFRRRPLAAPAMVYCAAVVAAAGVTVGSEFFGDPAPLAIAAPILAAVVVTRVPLMRERLWMAIPMLALGWIGGVFAIAVVDPRNIDRTIAMFENHGDPERLDTLALGGATIGREGVLVDTYNAPAVVLGRGNARGLLIPSDDSFALAMMFSRIRTPFVAVPNPRTILGAQDRLNRAFPQLYRDGPPGYRLSYQNEVWRLYARN